MKILVTGGAGFIGSAVVRHIIENTLDEVRVMDCLTYAGNLESLAPVAGGTLGGIALGIFVGQAGAYGLHDIFAHEVFAGDQLHGAVLPGLLGGNDLKNSGFQRCSSSMGPTGGDASAACGSRPACVHI